MPTGVIIPYGASIAPDGWHNCDGAVAYRRDFPELIEWAVENNAIGDGKLLGKGDGATTFIFPDLRNRAIMGANPNGEAEGNSSEIGEIQDAQLPNIVGRVNNVTIRDGGSGSPSGVFGESSYQGKARDEGSGDSFGYTNLIFNASFSNASSDHLGHNVYTTSGEVRSANVRLNFIIKT